MCVDAHTCMHVCEKDQLWVLFFRFCPLYFFETTLLLRTWCSQIWLGCLASEHQKCIFICLPSTETSACQHTKPSLNITVLVSLFMLVFIHLTQTGLSKKRDPKFRKYLHQIGLHGALVGISLINDWLGRAQPTVERATCGLQKHAGWATHGKQASKPEFLTLFPRWWTVNLEE